MPYLPNENNLKVVKNEAGYHPGPAMPIKADLAPLVILAK